MIPLLFFAELSPGTCIQTHVMADLLRQIVKAFVQATFIRADSLHLYNIPLRNSIAMNYF